MPDATPLYEKKVERKEIFFIPLPHRDKEREYHPCADAKKRFILWKIHKILFPK